MYYVYTDIGWGKQWHPMDSIELHSYVPLLQYVTYLHSITEWRGNLHQLPACFNSIEVVMAVLYASPCNSTLSGLIILRIPESLYGHVYTVCV